MSGELAQGYMAGLAGMSEPRQTDSDRLGMRQRGWLGDAEGGQLKQTRQAPRRGISPAPP